MVIPWPPTTLSAAGGLTNVAQISGTFHREALHGDHFPAPPVLRLLVMVNDRFPNKLFLSLDQGNGWKCMIPWYTAKKQSNGQFIGQNDDKP